MKYNFDITPDNKHNGSYRWNMIGMPEDVIGMGTADQDYFCAPCIKEKLLAVAEENCYNYRQKSDEYYNSVINWYKRNYDLDVKKEWLSNVPSTIGAIRVALGIFAEKNDNVIVQTPAFNPVIWSSEGKRYNIISNPMKIVNCRYEIDFTDFEEKIKTYSPKAFVLVNPHNPTGRVFTKEELTRLVDICYKYDVKVISDEVHCLVLYDGVVHTPILKVSNKAKEISIQIVSLSKGFNIMSLPHAIVTIANEKMQELWMEQIKAFSFGYATNSFSITAVTSILNGEADEWLKELTCYLKSNLDYALSYIKENNLPLIPYIPEGSFLLWLDVREAGIGTRNLDKFFLDKAHLHLDDGLDNFGLEGEGFIRINFAVTKAVLIEALERIAKVLKK